LLSRKFLILKSKDHNGESREDDVEDLVNPFLIEDLTTKS